MAEKDLTHVYAFQTQRLEIIIIYFSIICFANNVANDMKCQLHIIDHQHAHPVGVRLRYHIYGDQSYPPTVTSRVLGED